MDKVVYILSWKTVTLNAIKIYDEICKFHDKVYILNCDENFKIENRNVIVGDDTYFFTKQFFKCVNHCILNHKDSALMTITADVSADSNWSDVLNRCSYGLNNLNAGLIGPNINYTAWTKRHRHLRDNFWFVTNTDCTVWCIRPEIYTYILETGLDEWNKYGWGIDWILIEYSKKKHFYILRDYNNTIAHPRGSGYANKIAKSEFNRVKNLWNKHLKSKVK